MEHADHGHMKGGACGCGHHKLGPVLLILFGATFLLGNLNILDVEFVNIAWPILIIAGGFAKLGYCRCCA